MRIFIGVEFSREIKNRIIEIQGIIRDNSVRGRWKYIDNFHLTLKFLGEVPENQVHTLYEKLKFVLADIENIKIEGGEVGCFGSKDCLRVIYLGLKDHHGELDRIFNVIEECCFSLGFPKEKRKYTPHITIAQDVVLLREFNTLQEMTVRYAGLEVPVSKISIIKSEQIGNKRVYTPVHTINLKQINV